MLTKARIYLPTNVPARWLARFRNSTREDNEFSFRRVWLSTDRGSWSSPRCAGMAKIASGGPPGDTMLSSITANGWNAARTAGRSGTARPAGLRGRDPGDGWR